MHLWESRICSCQCSSLRRFHPAGVNVIGTDAAFWNQENELGLAFETQTPSWILVQHNRSLSGDMRIKRGRAVKPGFKPASINRTHITAESSSASCVRGHCVKHWIFLRAYSMLTRGANEKWRFTKALMRTSVCLCGSQAHSLGLPFSQWLAHISRCPLRRKCTEDVSARGVSGDEKWHRIWKGKHVI